MEKFRLLRADEIDCRIATVSEKGCSVLLYKDARCDMNILDETVGPMNWQRNHSRDNANCAVSIWDKEKGVWVSKEDTGTESFTEKEKGLASDSFKRACFNWGIGRELYTAPFIWISSENCKVEKKPDGRGYTCKDRFTVKDIRYDGNRCISRLVLTKKGTVVYEYGAIPREDIPEKIIPEATPSEAEDKATVPQIRTIKKLCERHRIPFENLLVSNGLTEDTLTGEKAVNLISTFRHKFGDE